MEDTSTASNVIIVQVYYYCNYLSKTLLYVVQLQNFFYFFILCHVFHGFLAEHVLLKCKRYSVIEVSL